MNRVGIRELKARLSSFIDQVKMGEEIIVTEHGVEVAVVKAVSTERQAIMALVKAGKAQWLGGKPEGLEGVKIKGKTISETILEQRQ